MERKAAWKMRRNLWKTRLGSRLARPLYAFAALAGKQASDCTSLRKRTSPCAPLRKRVSNCTPARKLASCGGISLAETLACCLILALSSSVLIQTLALAGDHFNTRTRESSARILCNTLSQSVQEYLSCATDWTVGPKDTVTDFTTGSIPSFEDPVRCSFVRTTEGFLALDYGNPETPLLLAPSADYAMHGGRPSLEVEHCTVTYEDGVFSVSIRVSPNHLGPHWDAAMQEVQNDFVVFPIPSSAKGTDTP